jgi:aryl-alcohol dehydrogenase-like predicted oxidoreductase
MSAQHSHVALGAWSGGRFMHFGEPLEDERLVELLTPDATLRTVITADVYGHGEADRIVARALQGTPRDEYFLVGAIGHDFYTGERQGAKGFPRFTATTDDHAGYIRMATERELERLGVDQLDVLLLHNPDRIGYTSESVWDGLEQVRSDGLTRELGVAPGPANGFTLDVIDCLERFGDRIDWAMVILNPLEPWPGEYVLPAAQQHGVKVITRVVDYGGLFWGDVRPGHEFAQYDHRKFRPAGWVEQGNEKLDALRAIAERRGLTLMGLACQYDLAQAAVEVTVPTLIQELDGRRVQDKKDELRAVPDRLVLTDEDLAEIRAIGDNTGCMALKGASPDHEGDALPDRWPLTEDLEDLASRWGIETGRLRLSHAAG